MTTTNTVSGLFTVTAATSRVTGMKAGSSTLSNVKNRLLIIQKFKKEHEEKLRKIKRMPQH